MFIYNGKRINIDAPFTAATGVTYANLRDPHIRGVYGVQEIVEPSPPEDYSDETYYRTEQDDAPYVVYTKKSYEQLEQLRKSKIQSQIDTMEASVMLPRVTREFMLLSMEAQFTPEQLEANFGYKKVKEFDLAIAALRAQL